MADEDNVVNPPEEANDPRLSSAAKDAFFANDPNAKSSDTEVEELPVPEEHQHHGHDVKFRDASIEDADFDAEEQNPKEPGE